MVSKIVYGCLIKSSEHFLLFFGNLNIQLVCSDYQLFLLVTFLKERSSLSKENVNYGVDEDRSINRDYLYGFQEGAILFTNSL